MIKVLRPLPSRPTDRAWRICLTGGIGTGKSALADALCALPQTIHFDADQVTREATAPGGCALPDIYEVFGNKVFLADGCLSREALSKTVFADSAAKQRLEQILHPLVWQELSRVTSSAGTAALVIAEVPLIAETGNHSFFDVIVTVSAPLQTRLDRLRLYRGMPAAEALSRINQQATDAQRRDITHIWVENNADFPSLNRAASEIYDLLR